MVKKSTVTSLFSDAGKKLQQDFESLRSSVPHSGLKGTGLERILIEFLNEKIPQKFRAASGIIIDSTDNISCQTDIVIYDAASSPVYYQNKEVRILPIETTASAIEVKTSLDKKQLEDAFKKIASCKALKTQSYEEENKKKPGGGLCGIVFAYTSNISIEKLGKHFVEIAKSYDSSLWPNFIVILDKGILNFYINFIGEDSGGPFFDFSGGSANGHSYPFHIRLAIDDQDLVIHKFMQYLFMNLNFFPERSIPLNYFKPKNSNLKIIENYQYNSNGSMNITPNDYLNSDKPPEAIIELRVNNKVEAHLNFSYWQDGAFILLSNGKLPLEMILMIPLGNDVKKLSFITSPKGFQMTPILKITKKDFLSWKDALDGPRTNFKARIIKQ